MYDTTTRTYTAQDASGSYDWIFENLDIEDYVSFNDEDITNWAKEIIEESKSRDIEEAQEQAEGLDFPRYGYSTDEQYEDADEWLEAKLEEIESDYEDELQSVVSAIREWIAEESRDAQEAAAVQAVVTTSEIDSEFGLPEGSARRDANLGKFATARKSGATWLIHRSEAARIYASVDLARHEEIGYRFGMALEALNADPEHYASVIMSRKVNGTFNEAQKGAVYAGVRRALAEWRQDTFAQNLQSAVADKIAAEERDMGAMVEDAEAFHEGVNAVLRGESLVYEPVESVRLYDVVDNSIRKAAFERGVEAGKLILSAWQSAWQAALGKD